MTGETARKKLNNNKIGYISLNRRREFGMRGQDAFFKALKNLVEDYRYLLNKDFINTSLLVHKDVKIIVDQWILETSH